MATPLFLLFIGLGNPGKEYQDTRHNIGEMVIRAFAAKHGWSFRTEAMFQAEIAKGRFLDAEILLLFPTTYMNVSGRAVKKVLDTFAIPYHHCCVIVDDVYLAFGEMRLRCQGGTGGHNGLQSLEECLGTDSFPRLRMGIGEKTRGETLSEYVLGKFSLQEREQLKDFIDRGVEVLEKSVTTPLSHLMNVVNFCNKRALVKPGEEKEKA